MREGYREAGVGKGRTGGESLHCYNNPGLFVLRTLKSEGEKVKETNQKAIHKSVIMSSPRPLTASSSKAAAEPTIATAPLYADSIKSLTVTILPRAPSPHTA